MSRRTSSLSTLTTLPSTIWPSSTLTIDASMAASKSMSRSSKAIVRGTYSSSSAGVRVAVWSDNGCSSRRDRKSMGPRAAVAQRTGTRQRYRSDPRASNSDRPLLTCGSPRDQEVLGVVDVGGVAGVATGLDGPDVLGLQADRAGQEAQLAGGEARGPQVGLGV